MPGSEKYFLGFNRDEIFKSLIASEGHFRYVTPTKDAGDLSCIVKHLADAEGHCDEAVSHSLIAEGEDVSRKFGELRDRIKVLRSKIQSKGVSASEGIVEIRSIRGLFESFNPEYDISRCTTCGPIEDVHKIEETFQSKGLNTDWDSILGETQRFKREKALNYRQTVNEAVKNDMVDRNEVLGIYGAELVAKAAERGFVEIDRSVGKLVAPLHERPSVWINMIGGIGIPLVTLWRKVKAPWDLPLIAAGGSLFSKIVTYLEEAISPVSVAVIETPRIVYKPAAVVTRVANQRVHTKAPAVAVGVGVGPSYSYAAYRGP